MNSYAKNKIREALALCNGNAAAARKQIALLAKDDPALLYTLTRPHLDGIIAYQVDRVAFGRAETDADISESYKSEAKESFGMEILRAVAAENVTLFGQGYNAAPAKKAASRRHIDAIHKIAATRNGKNKK